MNFELTKSERVDGPAVSGKATMAAAVDSPASSSAISMGSALGGRLLELSRRLRPLETARILESLVEESVLQEDEKLLVYYDVASTRTDRD